MPYYAGPFRVIAQIGANAFKLELTMDLLERKVHNVFNVSQLKKYHSATPLLNWKAQTYHLKQISQLTNQMISQMMTSKKLTTS